MRPFSGSKIIQLCAFTLMDMRHQEEKLDSTTSTCRSDERNGLSKLW